MTFLNYVKEVTDFAFSYNHFALIEPLCSKSIQQWQFFETIQVLEQVDFVKKSKLSGAFLDNWLDDNVLEDGPIEHPAFTVRKCVDRSRTLIIVEQC